MQVGPPQILLQLPRQSVECNCVSWASSNSTPAPPSECKVGLLKFYSSSPVRVQVGPPQTLLQLPRQSASWASSNSTPAPPSECSVQVGPPQTLLQLPRQSARLASSNSTPAPPSESHVLVCHAFVFETQHL